MTEGKLTNNNSDITVNDLPLKIGTRQLNTASYPVRSFYKLDFNDDAIELSLLNKGYKKDSDLNGQMDKIKENIRKRTPLTIHVVREDYAMDKELLIIDSVIDKFGDDAGLPVNFFRLQVQSLNEDEDFWLDSGAFNLSITTL